MRKRIILILAVLIINIMTFAQHRHGPKVAPLLQDMMNESYLPYIIKTSAEIGVFELLNGNSMAATEISDALKTKEKVTDALLGVLNATGIIDYNNGTYSLSQTASGYLVSSSPENQITWLNENTPVPAGEMAGLKSALSVKKQKPEKNNPSMSMWQNKENLVKMKSRMAGQIKNVTGFFESLPEFKECRKMMDYAGSIGYYSMAILDKNLKLQAHVYDLPVVCDIALEVQQDEKNFNRIRFHGFDIRNNDPIGEGYDLFFVSNALYGQRTKEQLVKFFTQANKSMEMGGVIVSNHWMSNNESEGYLSMTVTELENSFSGRPVHYLEEEILKQVLIETGFDNFTIKITDEDAPKPRLLIAARKVKDLN